MKAKNESKPRWEDRYATGDVPWDTGEPDKHLIEVVSERPIRPGRALEIGCGTGSDALWLTDQGFRVVGVDLSAGAVEKARARAAEAGAEITFQQLDFIQDELPAGPFDFVFDRGCFHVFDAAEERAEYARRVASLLAPEGVWLSLIGSTEGPERDHGPPRRTVRDVANAMEPELELLELRSIFFRANVPTPARAWRCLAAKRQMPAQPSTVRD